MSIQIQMLKVHKQNFQWATSHFTTALLKKMSFSVLCTRGGSVFQNLFFYINAKDFKESNSNILPCCSMLNRGFREFKNINIHVKIKQNVSFYLTKINSKNQNKKSYSGIKAQWQTIFHCVKHCCLMREMASCVCCQDSEPWHKWCDGQAETLMQVFDSGSCSSPRSLLRMQIHSCSLSQTLWEYELPSHAAGGN